MRHRQEDIMLEQYYKWLQIKHWDSNYFHMPNELPVNDKSMMIYAANLKRKGKKAGFSDAVVLEQHQGYGALFIEFKMVTGKPTFEQLIFLHNTTNNGYFSCIAYSLQAAIKITEWYKSDNKSSPLVDVKEFKEKGIEFAVKVAKE